PPVLSSILKGEISAGHKGEVRRVCVLFSDIRAFTARSENQSPQVIISLLNRYFEQMVDCVHCYDGTVDKFIGDGLMAFFGAPNSLDNSAQYALNAATTMLDRLDVLNQELRNEGVEPLNVGIGLHFGDVVVGHVGSSGRHEYTAIGDTVNVASRLEDLTRDLGYPILLSEDFHNALGENIHCTELGYQSLKGHSGMKVFGVGVNGDV
ncbi:MAG: adenylate/guanylate cyclase domain-containing protein, partial [bacterium]